MSPSPRFILASASPARLAMLRAAGLAPEVVVSGVDESTVDASDPVRLCGALARMKAEAVAATLNAGAHRSRADDTHADADADNAAATPTLVLGCDSMLAFDGLTLGKPSDEDDAASRWLRMRGRSGTLHTGHCLLRLDDQGRAVAEADEVTSTTVHFADLTDGEVAAYVATGEPLHVAGAFTIDGLGGWFVERIEGDHGTVVGVSLPAVRRLLTRTGTAVADLWPAALRLAP